MADLVIDRCLCTGEIMQAVYSCHKIFYTLLSLLIATRGLPCVAYLKQDAIMEFQYSGKLYLHVDGERVIGPGRVELLERIITSGSIRQAAKEMNMSYRQAWQYIDHMNTHLGKPVVIAERGGKGGGKTVVTNLGLQLIREFKSFHARFQEFLKENTFQPDQ